VETWDGADNDCDGQVDEGTAGSDDDGDGFTEEAGDCDDSQASRNPGAWEAPNGVDDDCDGLIDE
jgi:type IV pilus assembly protein PilY1